MIHDLGVIMLTAGIISLLFKFLKQPVVLGYIIAGMVAGPYFCGDSWITNTESLETWGEVGVIFLLFAMGLEFSFKKLVQVGVTAFVSTMVIVVGMMTTGFLVGLAMGWNEMNALFLGGMLCMSSTTIVFKALDDLGLRKQQFAKICLGILIVEDLFAVVLMVLLASIAVKNTFEGGQMLAEIGKLGGYLLLWFVCGIAIIPTFFKQCRKYLNDETMTIVSLGLCLGMVLLALSAGFSAALGAFVMGSILAETIEAERIESLVKPIKDMFGSIFFVSVGMMIDPSMLVKYWFPILVITLVVIVGQIVFASLGVLLSGQSLKVSMQSGFALVQIGEFAFIIASFGESLGITEKYLYPVVVAVSVITTFLTPYIIRLSEPAYSWVDAHLSRRTKYLLTRYSRSRNTITLQSTWRRLWKKVLLTLAINMVLIVFILTVYFQYMSPWIVGGMSLWLPLWAGRLVSLLLCLTVLSPFLYMIATKHARSEEFHELWHGNHFSRGTLVALTVLRLLLCLGVVIVVITHHFALTIGVLVGVSILVVFLLLLSKKVRNNTARIEQGFMENLSARESLKEQNRPMGKALVQTLMSYDLHIDDFTLTADSEYCGHKLMDLDLRKKSGVNVVRIVRGGMNINIPGGEERLYPLDRLVVAGSDKQISAFQTMLEKAEKSHDDSHPHREATRITLEQFEISPEMSICGKSIAESNIRHLASCSVIGIERKDQSIMNPNPQLAFEVGDVVILAGEAPRIKAFLEKVMR